MKIHSNLSYYVGSSRSESHKFKSNNNLCKSKSGDSRVALLWRTSNLISFYPPTSNTSLGGNTDRDRRTMMMPKTFGWRRNDEDGSSIAIILNGSVSLTEAIWIAWNRYINSPFIILVIIVTMVTIILLLVGWGLQLSRSCPIRRLSSIHQSFLLYSIADLIATHLSP